MGWPCGPDGLSLLVSVAAQELGVGMYFLGLVA